MKYKIIIFLILFFCFTIIAKADTEYSELSINEEFDIVNNYSDNDIWYYPNWTTETDGFDSPSFFTTTSTITTVQIYRKTGTSCNRYSHALDSTYALAVGSTTGGFHYYYATALDDSDPNICEFTISIPSGQDINGIGTSNLNTILLGNKSKIGASTTQTQEDKIENGGIAFQFCDSSTCDETFSTTPFTEFNNPDNLETLSDFSNWSITFGNLTNDLKQLGIHYSENLSKLEDCEEFPWGSGAGYTECINGSPNIFTDYGIATSLENGTVNIYKNNALTTGKTYYAQIVIQEDDPYGTNIIVSNIISFTIGIPTEETPVLETCATLNIFCHLKNAFTWAFIPTSESINQFTSLTLENSLPFSYVYDIGNLYEELFADTSEELDISIPFLRVHDKTT